MSRIPWDPEVNITKRKPSGMTSKVSEDEEKGFVPFKKKSTGEHVTKSKQRRTVVKLKTRLGVHGNDKAQSVTLMKHWKYRNFKRCGRCGEYDTYESRNPAWTRQKVTKERPDKQKYEVEVEVKHWCYKCGAINEDVVGNKYVEDDRFAPKERKSFCAECGKDIHFAKGDLAFPTGEIDPVTARADFNCKDCHETLEFYKKHPDMKPKK